jgi:hypothetical protein
MSLFRGSVHLISLIVDGREQSHLQLLNHILGHSAAAILRPGYRQ